MTYLDRKVDPMEPIHFLVIYNQEEYVQINYPEAFSKEKTLEELILPRVPGEIELILSQSRIEVGWCRVGHKTPESIERILKFNGVAARFGISLEDFQRRLERGERYE